MTAKLADPFSPKALRKALRAWEHSGELGSSPLTRLEITKAARLAAGYGDTPAGHGIALRGVLQAALEQLKPDNGLPQPTDKRWRPYLILHGQYIQGRSPDYLGEQLGVARSTYNHEQARALDRLLAQLQEWEAEGLPVDQTQRAAPFRGSAAPPTPFMAPPRLPQRLVGRDELVLQLKRLLMVGDPPPNVALHGLPGVGKTALAIELCHDPEVRARYEDGVLWAGLGPNPDPGVLLHLWELALGFAHEELGSFHRIQDRAKAIHAAVGLRRMLLVLDDVWHAEPTNVLRVGGPHCATIFTTRMPGVVHELESESVLRVPELEEAPSLELLARLVPQLITKLEGRARELADASGGLPLALDLLGRALRKDLYGGHPRRVIEALDRLRDPAVLLRVERRRSAIEGQPGLPPDTAESLEAIIALSEQALDEEARLAFHALSVFPPKPSSFDEPAAAAVTGRPMQALDRLVDAGLVEGVDPDRYAVQRTISEYGRLRLAERGPHHAFVGYFMNFIEGNREAFPRLDLEIHNVLAALETAYEAGPNPQYVQAVNALFPYLESAGLKDQAGVILSRAQQAAAELDDRPALAEVLVNLGRAALRQARLSKAADHFKDGLRVAEETGEIETMCACLQGLGSVALSRAGFGEAERHYLKALKLAEDAELQARQASLLSNLGMLASNQGNALAAEERFRQGLSLARESGDMPLVVTLLTNLGAMSAKSGRLEDAEAFLQESLELARAAGNRRAMGFLLSNLGALAHDHGDDERAGTYFEQALSQARQIGDAARISHILANLGALATARRDFERAEALLQEGLALARQLDHQENMMLLMINLGQLAKEKGELEEALRNSREALARATEAGHARYQAIAQAYLGELQFLLGNLPDARKAFEAALSSAEQFGMVEPKADALFGLAKVEEAQGRLDSALPRGEEALQIYASISHQKASEVRAWLEETRPESPVDD